jgi:hypothetical protein
VEGDKQAAENKVGKVHIVAGNVECEHGGGKHRHYYIRMTGTTCIVLAVLPHSGNDQGCLSHADIATALENHE